MKRALNRGLIQLFYDYGVNVPAINAAISRLDTSGRKTMEDLSDRPEEDV